MASSETFFSLLKSHRESKDIGIEEIAEYTKINPRYLNAIESGDFSMVSDVYMRLFIRSYVQYIGSDAQQALEDYELYTTGKVREKVEMTFQPAEADDIEDGETGAFSFDSEFQIPPKRIITIAAVLLGIFVLFKIVSNLSQQQVAKVNTQIENTIPNKDILTPENVDTKTVSNNVNNQITITKTQVKQLIDNNILNDDDFSQERYIGEVGYFLQKGSPSTLQLTTSSRTKVNIFSSNEEKTIAFNRVIPADTTLIFTFDSTLYFDLYSASHLKAYLNNELLDKYFTQNDSALRGSFDLETGHLDVRYYRHR